MVEKGIRGRICHSILWYVKANNKYINNYNKDEEGSCLQYDDANNLYGFAMIQRLPVDSFFWIENVFETDEDFIKSYDENSDTYLDIYLKQMLNILKIYMICMVIYHTYQK